MKRLVFTLVALASIGFTSCREEEKKDTEVVKEVEVIREKEVEVQKEENKGILERTAEKVDDEVNKEIDEEIEKIGDDN